MGEITDSTGNKVPVSQVKCVHNGLHGKARNSKLFDTDPDGPYHFIFETIDGRRLSTQDYPDQKTAYAEKEKLKASVEQLAKQRRSEVGP